MQERVERKHKICEIENEATMAKITKIIKTVDILE